MPIRGGQRGGGGGGSGANLADLVRRLEAELVRSALLSMAADEPRNRLELLGAVERLAQKGSPPLLLIDGLRRPALS